MKGYKSRQDAKVNMLDIMLVRLSQKWQFTIRLGV